MKKFLPFILLLFTASVFSQYQKTTSTEEIEKVINKIVANSKSNFGQKSLVLRLDSTLENYNLPNPFWKTEYTYTSTGLIHEVISGKFEGNVWTPLTKLSYVYGTNDDLTNKLYYNWHSINNTWSNSRNDVYTYNALGDTSVVLIQFWNSSNMDWVNSSKYSYTYDANGNVDVLSCCNFYSSYNCYDDYRVEFSYNSNQTVSSALVEIFDDYIWEYKNQYFWDYDANNFLISYTVTYLNTNSYVLYSYTNNSTGHPVIEEVNVFHENNWTPSYKHENILNSDNYILQKIHNSFDSNSSNWYVAKITDYFYHALTSVNDIANNTSVRTYPNPVSDVLIINSDDEISNLRIFNITGQLVASFNPASKEATIDVSSFANGVYFVHVLSKDGNSVQKIIVQH